MVWLFWSFRKGVFNIATQEALLADIARVEAMRGDPVKEAYFATHYGSLSGYLSSQYSRLSALTTSSTPPVTVQETNKTGGQDVKQTDSRELRKQAAAPAPVKTYERGGSAVQSPFDFFGGIGDFFNTWAPWLMIIALVYAIGTVFNINLRAGLGK
jgi:hypothetical protein